MKTFKSLTDVMEPFLNVKNFKSPKKVMESFFGIKNFTTVMVSFFRLKTFRVVRKQRLFSVLKTVRAVRQWWNSL